MGLSIVFIILGMISSCLGLTFYFLQLGNMYLYGGLAIGGHIVMLISLICLVCMAFKVRKREIYNHM